MYNDEHNPEPREDFGHGLLWSNENDTDRLMDDHNTKHVLNLVHLMNANRKIEHLKELLLFAKKYVPESAYGYSHDETLRDQITEALAD